MERNQFPVVDVRRVMSGKDGMLYDQDGNPLVSVQDFSSQANITNATFQPLGSAMERSSMTSYNVKLTLTEIVVESGLFFIQIMEGLRTSRMPVFTFRGVMHDPYGDGKEEVVYRDCVPDGTIDIQNMAVGELYKRAWSFNANQSPDLQSSL
jgi:hypothetical protein